jgi:hypothetical protein
VKPGLGILQDLSNERGHPSEDQLYIDCETAAVDNVTFDVISSESCHYFLPH